MRCYEGERDHIAGAIKQGSGRHGLDVIGQRWPPMVDPANRSSLGLMHGQDDKVRYFEIGNEIRGLCDREVDKRGRTLCERRHSSAEATIFTTRTA